MENSRNKNKIKICAIFSLAAAVAFAPRAFLIADTTTTAVTTAAATTTSTTLDAGLEAERQQKEQQLNQLNQQISDLQNQINSAQKQQASLKGTLALYDTQIRQTQIQIQAAQTSIDNTQIQIQETQNQIDDKTKQINDEKAVLADLINTLNQYQDSAGLQLAFGSGSFSDILDQLQYTSTVSDKVHQLVQQIKDLKAKLEQDEKDLQTRLSQLNTQQQALKQTEATLNDERDSKEALLTQTKGREANFQKLLVSSKDQEAQIDQEINNLDSQIQGKKGFNSLKPIHGILAYPLQGVMTQGYGNTGFTQLGYDFHNGIDIAAPAGSPISAAADGIVFATGRGEAAYGNWVVIKHNITATGGHQILTLYGHMRSFIVSPGQVVRQGDLIGYEGNTGNTTRLLCNCPDRGYHLHFTVFDAVDFGIKDGAYPKVYGPYQIPYGYTYNPLDFL